MAAVIPQGQFHIANPDRKCVLATSIIKYFEKSIAEIVRFAKRIPGFTDLPMDDQANLIRGARIECDFISGIVIDPDSMITMSEDGEWFTPEDIATIFTIDFWMEHAKMSRKIDQMKMTREEVAILKALTVFSPDRCIISETSKVSNIQDTLLRCLNYQVSKSYKRPAVRLGQLFALLTSLRSITDAGTKELKKMFIEFPSMTKGSIAEEVMDE
ncbi:nuclear receptor subfamily 1 group D member 2-like [Dreissena polymorpha]|uniref:nuclear receptor subfamily 1 group D member 2-like n=1 Tax=Dreissena polymorpha TaxID=45954 RepID=UPI0022650C53|nr:nuclear receptor subfamily 1 group D member 2-like [Dreissena polymorpha]